MIEGSGAGSQSGSGSIPLTNGPGSGSRRLKNTWIQWIRIRIQIRIRNTELLAETICLCAVMYDIIIAHTFLCCVGTGLSNKNRIEYLFSLGHCYR
jgi:hypothetical protein